MVQLESAADPAAEGACLAVWASFTLGAGDHNCLPVGCLSVCGCLHLLAFKEHNAALSMQGCPYNDEAHLIQ